jgi:hypothetical protein
MEKNMVLTHGQRFESIIIRRMRVLCDKGIEMHMTGNKGDARIIINNDKSLDLYEGTDCFIDEIPTDITLNPSKDHVFWQKTMDFGFMKVHLGVRTSNKCHTFATPTLVIRFETTAFDTHAAIVGFLGVSDVNAIISDGIDAYYAGIDEIEAQKAVVFA